LCTNATTAGVNRRLSRMRWLCIWHFYEQLQKIFGVCFFSFYLFAWCLVLHKICCAWKGACVDLFDVDIQSCCWWQKPKQNNAKVVRFRTFDIFVSTASWSMPIELCGKPENFLKLASQQVSSSINLTSVFLLQVTWFFFFYIFFW